MSRRSGYRFADKDMRQRVKLEHIPIPQEWDVLYAARIDARNLSISSLSRLLSLASDCAEEST